MDPENFSTGGEGGGVRRLFEIQKFPVGVFLFAIKGKEKRPGVLLSILPCKI